MDTKAGKLSHTVTHTHTQMCDCGSGVCVCVSAVTERLLSSDWLQTGAAFLLYYPSIINNLISDQCQLRPRPPGLRGQQAVV